MSNSYDNELTIFFRPTNSQPYVIVKCAMWLYSIGRSRNVKNTYRYLVWLENHHPAKFKQIISEYHRASTFVTGYLTDNDDSTAFRSSTGLYGDEDHMYANREMSNIRIY